jgi:hypothetical protein
MQLGVMQDFIFPLGGKTALTKDKTIDFKITKRFSLMTNVRMKNAIIHPVTNDFDREWAFNGAMFIGTFHLK